VRVDELSSLVVLVEVVGDAGAEKGMRMKEREGER
jgi:hypothetical protein